MELFVALRYAWNNISLSGRRWILVLSTSQSFLIILDLFGLLMFAKLISFSVNRKLNPSNPTSSKLFESFIPSNQIASNTPKFILLIILLFVGKGALSLLVNQSILRIMSREAVELTKITTKKFLSLAPEKVANINSSDFAFTISEGIQSLFFGTFNSGLMITLDSLLIFFVSVAVVAINPLVSLYTFVYFTLVGFCLKVLVNMLTKGAYRQDVQSTTRTYSLVREILFSVRELSDSEKMKHFTDELFEIRSAGVKAVRQVSFAQLLPRYVYELSLFVGIGLIWFFVSLMHGNQTQAISAMGIFILAGSRITPSLLRIQFFSTVFQKSNAQTAKLIEIDLRLLEPVKFPDFSRKELSTQSLDLGKLDSTVMEFIPEIVMESASFSFDGSRKTLSDVSLTINSGEFVCFMGKSGSGKSTCADIISGFRELQNGSINISGLSPRAVKAAWPKKIGYLPQRISMFNRSILENVALGVARDSIDVKKVTRLLDLVGLRDFYSQLDKGLETNIGEIGANLSGGQLQRIGIARVLYDEPELLILDESTSGLDIENERNFLNYLREIRGKYTIIFIAHRESIAREADMIYYFESGKIVASGKYAQLEKLITKEGGFSDPKENLFQKQD